MNLKLQIYSIVISLVYGYIFSALVNLNYRILFFKKKYFRIMIDLIFVIDFALLYFLIIKYLNGGIINLYLYLMLTIGFFLGFKETKVLRKILNRLRYNVKKV